MPNSVTKGTVTEETIDRMVQRAFGEKALEMQELKEGYFNIAYRIRLKDRNVVLKIAPSPEIRVMTCEKNIMFSEVDSMRMAAKRTKVPVPRILFYDNSGSVIDREYFFMEMLGGQSLSGLQDALPEEDKQEIYYRLGQYTRQLNHIRGERFGYYGQPDRQGENWYEVFRDMVRDTYADAERKDIPMPVKEEETLALLERDRSIFEAVKTPRFVHWDIWAGNVFVADNRIEGIIDFERCLWADALMEVGFRNYEYNQAFYQGYGIEELTGEEKRRARWYDVYVALLWCLETDYRGYDNRDFYHMGCQAARSGIEDLRSGTYMRKDYYITEIKEQGKKSPYAREVLESLPEWFGNKASLEEYVEKVQELPFWAALNEEGKCLGFFSVRMHYGHTGDIYVCGVRPECHRMGIGKALYEQAERFFLEKGCKYAMVETLSETVDYAPYEKTRHFYESIGFEPLITLTEMWDEDNPCLIMIKPLAMEVKQWK